MSILANYAWTGSPGTIHSGGEGRRDVDDPDARGGVGAAWDQGQRSRARANRGVPGAAKQLWNTQAAVDRITAVVPNLKR